MKEFIKDCSFKNRSSIPNSYIFQPESIQRNWLQKRGKGSHDVNQKSLARMKQFFKSLDTNDSGYILRDQVEEILLSLGLCQTTTEVSLQIQELNRDIDGRFDFESFLQLLRQTSAIGRNSSRSPNYLLEKTLLGEKVKTQTIKLPQLSGLHSTINATQFF